MNRKTAAVLSLLLLTAAACAAFLLLRPRGGERPVARITLDGELVEEIDLSAVVQPRSFPVEDGAGGSNTILVEPGRIRVSGANCPDQICVTQGFISDGAVPIVCLPHRLIIQITGGGESLDAAAG